jgi:phosphoserine phosphatase
MTKFFLFLTTLLVMPLAHAAQWIDEKDPTLASLDVTADGRIDQHDVMIWQKLVQFAQPDPQNTYYFGTAKPAVLATLKLPDFGAPSLTPQQRRELFFEARWRLQAAKLAVATTADLKPLGGFLSDVLPGYNKDTLSAQALCTGFQKMDLRRFKQTGVPTVAIFDLDGTVWPNDVMDGFLQILVLKKLPLAENNEVLQTYLKNVVPGKSADIEKQDVIQNAALLLQLWTDPSKPRDKPPSAKDVFEQVINLINGLSEKQVVQAAHAVFETGTGDYKPWKNRQYTDGQGCGFKEMVSILKKRGVDVYILSATLDFLSDEAARNWRLDKDRAFGSRLEIKNGKYTGKLLETTYSHKGEIARQILPAPPLFAFGDSARSDFGMLQEALVAGFMINTSEALLERDQKEAQDRLVTVKFTQTEADHR